ncbi:MAG: acetylxylan esterase [Anaerolineales bacterium]|nr:acetylxylan esterase [Anaerolineales bacterium]
MKKTALIFYAILLTACAASGRAVPTPLWPATPTTNTLPAQATPTQTPLPTATLTAEQALFPFTIEGLRQHQFTSGEIFINATLLETETFTRYAISYPSDGLTITGILQIPKIGQPPYPVIVMNHGFFSRYVYHSGDGTDRAAEFLNRRGYLTVSSDYRTWGNSGTGESLFYSGLAIDVINLINALPSLPAADVNRIGMWGHSMGGGVTLKVLTIDARIKAAVLYSSVSGDFGEIIERWGPGCLGDVLEGEASLACNSSDVLPFSLPQNLIDAYFEATTDAEALKTVSPIYHLNYVTAPVQINYGTEDGKVSSGTPPEWSRKLYAAFLEANQEARLIGVEGEVHSFKYDAWFHFMERSAQFFDQYVK